MPILTHGSDLSLAPTLRAFTDASRAGPRSAIAVVASEGFRSVQLDATIAGIRPRELDQSARRDLMATVHRAGLSVAGLDLLIPTEHYQDPAHIDRAADALHQALGLAADLGRVPVTLHAPDPESDRGLIDDLLAVADGLGVRLVMLIQDDTDRLDRWLKQHAPGVVGAAIDPATLLTVRHDPVARVHALGDRLAVARLSDTRRGQADGARMTVGAGDLDLAAYRIAIDLAPKRVGPVVLDLRALGDPIPAAQAGRHAWASAATAL